MLLLDFSKSKATIVRPTFSKIAWTTTVKIDLAVWKANTKCTSLIFISTRGCFPFPTWG